MQTCPTCGADFQDGFACPYDGQRLVPKMIDRYRLLRRVAVGGMAEVYEAEHTYVNKRVALKILRRHLASDPEPAERMYREARAASSVGHRNIVRIEDFGRVLGGEVYLVMEWLEGDSLETILDAGGVSEDEALDFAIQACAGLGAAHDAGIVHRDVKPGNLFIAREEGGAGVVKIVDFGIAKLLSREFLHLTKTGALIGTPCYIAPEQARGREVDHRCDIYSLGVILYEMFSGCPPFAAESPIELVRMHANDEPERPSEKPGTRAVNPAIETIIMRCLEKDPAARYQTMGELQNLLETVRAPRSTLHGLAVQAERTQQSIPRIDSAPIEAHAPSPSPSPSPSPLPNHAASGEPVAAEDDPALKPAWHAAEPPAPMTPPPVVEGSPDAAERLRSGKTMALAEARRGRAVAVAVAMVAIVAVVIVSIAALSGTGDAESRAEASEAAKGSRASLGGADESGAGSGAAAGGDSAREGAGAAAGGDSAREGAGADAGVGARSATREAEPWTVRRTHRGISLRIEALPRPLRAGQPILLDAHVTSERESVAKAIASGEVRGDVRFLHYLRHEKTGTTRADVAADGRFRLAMTVPQDGKYHLTVKLSRDGRVLGRLQVDLCVGVDPESPDADEVCPRLNSAHDK